MLPESGGFQEAWRQTLCLLHSKNAQNALRWTNAMRSAYAQFTDAPVNA
jgi:hypothetical protein